MGVIRGFLERGGRGEEVRFRFGVWEVSMLVGRVWEGEVCGVGWGFLGGGWGFWCWFFWGGSVYLDELI